MLIPLKALLCLFPVLANSRCGTSKENKGAFGLVGSLFSFSVGFSVFIFSWYVFTILYSLCYTEILNTRRKSCFYYFLHKALKTGNLVFL